MTCLDGREALTRLLARQPWHWIASSAMRAALAFEGVQAEADRSRVVEGEVFCCVDCKAPWNGGEAPEAGHVFGCAAEARMAQAHEAVRRAALDLRPFGELPPGAVETCQFCGRALPLSDVTTPFGYQCRACDECSRRCGSVP